MCSDIITGIELVSNNAIKKLKDLVGPSSFQEAKQKAPNSLRGLYATSDLKNVIHASD